jgi:hypothetical protein
MGSGKGNWLRFVQFAVLSVRIVPSGLLAVCRGLLSRSRKNTRDLRQQVSKVSKTTSLKSPLKLLPNLASFCEKRLNTPLDCITLFIQPMHDL